MQPYRPRLLVPVYSVSASKLLLQTEVQSHLSKLLKNVRSSLLRQIPDRLGLL